MRDITSINMFYNTVHHQYQTCRSTLTGTADFTLKPHFRYPNSLSSCLRYLIYGKKSMQAHAIEDTKRGFHCFKVY